MIGGYDIILDSKGYDLYGYIVKGLAKEWPDAVYCSVENEICSPIANLTAMSEVFILRNSRDFQMFCSGDEKVYFIHLMERNGKVTIVVDQKHSEMYNLVSKLVEGLNYGEL